MAEKPKYASQYKSEQVELVRAASGRRGRVHQPAAYESELDVRCRGPSQQQRRVKQPRARRTCPMQARVRRTQRGRRVTRIVSLFALAASSAWCICKSAPGLWRSVCVARKSFSCWNSKGTSLILELHAKLREVETSVGDAFRMLEEAQKRDGAAP